MVSSGSSGKDGVSISGDGKTTLNDLITKGEKIGGAKFWTYSTTNNCQAFVRDLLKGSGFLTGELSTYIMQNAAGLLKDSPLTSKIANTVTNIGASINTLLTGAGHLED